MKGERRREIEERINYWPSFDLIEGNNDLSWESPRKNERKEGTEGMSKRKKERKKEIKKQGKSEIRERGKGKRKKDGKKEEKGKRKKGRCKVEGKKKKRKEEETARSIGEARIFGDSGE